MKKKFLSILLTLTLALTLIPTAALADTTEDATPGEQSGQSDTVPSTEDKGVTTEEELRNAVKQGGLLL